MITWESWLIRGRGGVLTRGWCTAGWVMSPTGMLTWFSSDYAMPMGLRSDTVMIRSRASPTGKPRSSQNAAISVSCKQAPTRAVVHENADTLARRGNVLLNGDMGFERL